MDRSPESYPANSTLGIVVTENESESTVLRLDHFLKLASISDSGGQAKLMIQGGEVKVNGEVETRRRRKLNAGDVVEVGDKQFPVE